MQPICRISERSKDKRAPLKAKAKLVFVKLTCGPSSSNRTSQLMRLDLKNLMSYAKRCGGLALVDFCFSNWDKLQGIIAKSWKAEKVEEFVETATRSRIELLHNAQVGDCTCGGQWATFARTILNQNGHDPAAQALASARSKGNLVTHAGFEGNEGKSFLFRPLPLVYGEENVFVTPPKSAFPLLGLEKARLVWLDDWRFNEDLISWAFQLLWFEGASFIIGRPQNLYLLAISGTPKMIQCS